ncbi:MAG TPA: ABC transporter permease [Candidatus Angelobacter sp.]|jgi:predicted permease
MDTFVQDLKYTIRILIKNPAYSLLAILTLGLGIGGNATIFGWVEGVMLEPLGGAANQSRLVAIAGIRQPGDRCCTFTYPDYKDFNEQNAVFDGILAAELSQINLGSDGDPVRIAGQNVSGNYFQVLGIRPLLGRFFAPEEDRNPLSDPVSVISYGLWQRRYGGDPKIIGKTQVLNNRTFTIIGVAPKDFIGTFTGYAIDIWTPMMMEQAFYPGGDRTKDRENFWLEGFARLKPGVSMQQAQEQLTAISLWIQRQYPTESHRGFVMTAFPLSQTPFGISDTLTPVLGLSLAVVIVVLLIACANLAGLVLARSLARGQEIAVRMAIGASRRRVVRQMLTESMLLALLGGIVGTFIAYMLSGALAAFFPANSISITVRGRLDGRVLATTALITLVTGFLFGLTPALQSSRGNLVRSLKLKQGSVASGSGKSWMRSGLVALQIALSLVLLIGAMLFFQSIRNTQRVDFGFNPNHILTANIDLFGSGYDEPRGKVFYQQFLSKVENMPSIQSATLAWRLPMTPRLPQYFPVMVPGYVVPSEKDRPYAEHNKVGPDYMKTMGIELIAGRDFTTQDVETAPAVCIVNETMAHRYWPKQNAVGQRVQILGKWAEIVGVAKDVKYHTVSEASRPYIYLPIFQFHDSPAAFVIRTAGDPNQMTQPLRIAAREFNPHLLIFDIRSLITYMEFSTFSQRISSILLAIFGTLALLLAAMGIYGVVSLGVAQRVHEIGIRMALGAQRSEILALILRQGLTMASVGIVFGLIAAFASTRLIANQIYGISATDPGTFIAITFLLLGIALMASLIPASRASRVDPLKSLREE